MSGEKAALITGASTGIGEACAKMLADEGWRVYAGVRKPEDGERLVAHAPERIAAVQVDVTDSAQIAAAAKQIADERDSLDALLNNAGIAVAGPMEFIELDDFRRQIEINVTGQVAVTQAFLPLLRAGRGRLSFMSSTNGYISTPFMGPYCASKYALEAVADALRVELKPWGMEVSIIQPGAIATPIWDKAKSDGEAMAAGMPEAAESLYGGAMDALRRMVAITEQKRTIPAEEVAKCVLHAFTAKKPHTRYRVGKDTGQQYFAGRWLPDRLRDFVVAKAMGLPG